MADPGRPTKYNKQIQKAAEKYLKEYNLYGDVVPTTCGLACIIEVSKSTIYKWAKENEQFSDTLRQIQEKQETVLINNGLNSTFHPTITKLMLANHGYHDKQEIEHSGSDPINVIIQPVTNADKNKPDS